MIEKVIKNKQVSRLVYSFLYACIAKRQYWKNREAFKKIRSLKGAFEGKRCFVIGTGPSLTISDLEKLRDEYTFGTNRIYELFDQTDWRPTFYVNQDSELIKKFRDRIAAVPSKYLFLPVDFKSLFDEDSRINYFVLKHKEFYPQMAPFSRNVSKYLSQGFTVTYGAIQIAVYLGFKEIYLIGVDHNYSIIRDAEGNIIKNETDSNYPKGMQDFINKGNLPRVVETTIAYDTAEKVSRRMGFRIFNATRGGKLESFERIQLEDIIK